ncbi:hypothetical protein FB451DRAFT_1373627 [Mycena latifolia]|nr:hypothetical protein FB451DRAFT_1373627 [Mycena latifolia]
MRRARPSTVALLSVLMDRLSYSVRRARRTPSEYVKRGGRTLRGDARQDHVRAAPLARHPAVLFTPHRQHTPAHSASRAVPRKRVGGGAPLPARRILAPGQRSLEIQGDEFATLDGGCSRRCARPAAPSVSTLRAAPANRTLEHKTPCHLRLRLQRLTFKAHTVDTLTRHSRFHAFRISHIWKSIFPRTTRSCTTGILPILTPLSHTAPALRALALNLHVSLSEFRARTASPRDLTIFEPEANAQTLAALEDVPFSATAFPRCIWTLVCIDALIDDSYAPLVFGRFRAAVKRGMPQVRAEGRLVLCEGEAAGGASSGDVVIVNGKFVESNLSRSFGLRESRHATYEGSDNRALVAAALVIAATVVDDLRTWTVDEGRASQISATASAEFFCLPMIVQRRTAGAMSAEVKKGFFTRRRWRSGSEPHRHAILKVHDLKAKIGRSGETSLAASRLLVVN